MAQNTYAATCWTDDNNKLSSHHLKFIKAPLKAWNAYKVGDKGRAVYPGTHREWDFEILAVGESKKAMDAWIQKYMAADKPQEHVKSTKLVKVAKSNKKGGNPHSEKVRSMLHAAQMMPFVKSFQANQEDTDDCSEDSEEAETLEEKVKKNKEKNMEFLRESGIFSVRPAKPPKKARPAKPASAARKLCDLDLDLTDEDSSSGEEEKEQEIEGCDCTDCPWKKKVQEYELEGISNGGAGISNGRAGIYTSESAVQNKMVEIVPGTNVYIPLHIKDLVFASANTRSELAAKLLQTFYKHEDFVRAGSLKALPRSDIISKAIISCALRYKRDDLKQVATRKLRKALYNVVQYAKRDKEEMRRKRRRRRQERAV